MYEDTQVDTHMRNGYDLTVFQACALVAVI